MPTALTSSAKTYTLEEFWALPEPEDRSKLELIGGYLYMSPPPASSHDSVASRLMRILVRHLDSEGLDGELLLPRAAIWTSDRTHLEPDLFYVSVEKAATFQGGNRTSADLVVEILSPGSRVYDRTKKAETYGALGVNELWLIDEDARTVEVRQQTGGGFGASRTFTGKDAIVSAVFPGLTFSIDRLFRP